MSTTVSLEKGERVDLTKTNPGLKVAHVGLGWDVAQTGSAAFDLDAFALVLKGGKLFDGNSSVIYFGHKTAHGLEHMGDNLTGAGDGDDETIKIHLSQVPGDEILLCVNIYQADTRHQNFGMVNNAFIRIYDGETGGEILKFDLSEDYSKFNAMIMGKLYKKDEEWKFQAVGTGANGDINTIAQPFV
jgi:tellurium resistance protein TerD